MLEDLSRIDFVAKKGKGKIPCYEANEKEKELNKDVDLLQMKCDKLASQLADREHLQSKELDVVEKRVEEQSQNFERQARELRSQIATKNKEITNQRDEISDLDSRLRQKTTELRNVKVQL